MRKFSADGGAPICANNEDELTEGLEAVAGKHDLNCRRVWGDQVYGLEGLERDGLQNNWCAPRDWKLIRRAGD